MAHLPRAYIPLKTVPAAYPFPLKFENGVALVSHEEFPPQHFKGWEEVFSRRELQDLGQWHHAIACDCGVGAGIQGKASPKARLANVRALLCSSRRQSERSFPSLSASGMTEKLQA